MKGAPPFNSFECNFYATFELHYHSKSRASGMKPFCHHRLIPSGTISLLIRICLGYKCIFKRGCDPFPVKTPSRIVGYPYIHMTVTDTRCCQKARRVARFLSPNAILRCVIFTLRICPLFTWRVELIFPFECFACGLDIKLNFQYACNIYSWKFYGQIFILHPR